MTFYPDLDDYPTLQSETLGYLYWHCWDIDDTGLYFSRRSPEDFETAQYQLCDYLGKCSYVQAEEFSKSLPDEMYPEIEPLQFKFDVFIAATV